MKKVLALSLVLAMCCGLLASCTGASPDELPPPTKGSRGDKGDTSAVVLYEER